MKTLTAALFVMVQALTCIAQPAVDSLKKVLETEPATSGRIRLRLNEIARANALDSNRIMCIADWIIKNSSADSMAETRAGAYFALGRMHTILSNFRDAASYLTMSLEIAEAKHFPKVQADALNALGAVYNNNEQYEKAAQLYQQSYEIAGSARYELGMSKALYNLAQLKLNSEQFSMTRLAACRDLARQSLVHARLAKDTVSIVLQSRGLGTIFRHMHQYDSALAMLLYAETLIPKNTKDLSYISHFSNLVRLQYAKKDYRTAIKYYEIGLNMAKEFDLPRLMCTYYSGLAETFEMMGDFKNANHYNILNMRMHDALISRENFVAAADIRNKYEREKKQQEFEKLTEANRQKSKLNKLLGGAAIGLFLIIFLGSLNFKNRVKIAKQQEEIQLQKILQLEKDRQLISIDAMLKGQEEERNRIAKDLHDGLGGILSGTKLSFVNLKETLAPGNGHDHQFARSISMLDNAIGDLRKIAQNLMPQAFAKFGLSEALRDFCDSVQVATGIKVKFRQFGIDRKPDNTVSIYLFRIVQELVNNAVKHAHASMIFVQLTMNANSTTITVEDDGQGFDKAILATSKGAGMSNISYRVQYLNGSTDIVSSPGHGTSVNIDLKV